VTLESDKAEVISFLNFLQKREIEFLAYRTLFSALNHAYPEEHLPEKFLGLVNPPMGTEVRKKYAPLVELVQKSTDSTALVSAVLRWIQSRKQ